MVVGVHHVTCSGWLCVLPGCCVWGCLCFVESKWAGMSRVATSVHLMTTGQPTPKLPPRNKGFGEILSFGQIDDS